MSKNEPRWNLHITYRCGFPDYDLDARIEKVVGRSGDSGFGMGQRELDFDFHQKASALAAEERVRKMNGIDGLTVELNDTKERWGG